MGPALGVGAEAWSSGHRLPQLRHQAVNAGRGQLVRVALDASEHAVVGQALASLDDARVGVGSAA